jgi:toxin ParE1/3/4
MSRYELAPDAETDLLEIARYTIRTWGPRQADLYKADLIACFEALGEEKARSSKLISHRKDLRVCRCQHHYVFSVQEPGTTPLIVAIFHEKMDLMERLKTRLKMITNG